MGMFDTLYFDKPYTCPRCGAALENMQTKELKDPALCHFHLKDTISHPEDIRIVKEQLFCDSCGDVGRFVYLVIVMGLWIGVADSLAEAKNMMLSELNAGS